MLLQRRHQRVPLPSRRFRPHPNPLIRRPGVNRPVAGDDHRVDGVLVRFDGLQATEIGSTPYLQALVPRNGVDQTVVDGEAGDGVGVLDPEPFLVTADGDVVLREGETVQTVVDGGETGQQLMPFC